MQKADRWDIHQSVRIENETAFDLMDQRRDINQAFDFIEFEYSRQ